jgi:deoxyguanosine kinase
MSEVYLLLGSNKGERIYYLERATSMLSLLSCEGTEIVSSPVFESEPWGFETNNWFLNKAVKVESFLSPEVLIDSVLDIERRLGRKRSSLVDGYESREIDIDIIFISNMILNSSKLVVPHPRMAERRFVLEPLCVIAPYFIHPVFGKQVQELLNECSDNSVVRSYSGQ